MATVQWWILGVGAGTGALLVYYSNAFKRNSSTEPRGRRFQNEEKREQEIRRAPGLTQLWPGDGSTTGATIDIIAIHGLDTQSPTTWEAYRNGKDDTDGRVHWLKDADMLPSQFPECRIFTYDWLSTTHNNAIQDGLRGHADTLLDELKNRQNPNRHLILIASSFGGLLVAKAVTLAYSEESRHYGTIKESTGMIFLGTPFRNIDAGNMAMIRVRVARAIGGETCDALVRYLTKDDNALEEMAGQFGRIVRKNDHKIRLICYYETRPTQILNAIFPGWIANLIPFGKLILVPKDCVRVADSELRPIHVKHSLLAKFFGPKDPNFGIVCHGLKDLVNQARQLDIHNMLEEYYDGNEGRRLRIERLSGDHLPMDDCYINLCIIEHDRDSNMRAARSANVDASGALSNFSLLSRLKIETPPETKQVTLQTLFSPRKRQDGTVVPPNRVLIWGRAGVGKSTLCKKIVHDFVHKKLWNDLFDHVFWFPLRELKLDGMKSDSLEGLILNKFSGKIDSESELLRTQLRRINPGRTLFVLDGLDEVSHVLDPDISVGRERVFGELLRCQNVIITSRPHSTKVLRDMPPHLELETIGFSQDQVEEYLEHVGQQTPLIIPEIQSFIQSHPIVQNLVRIPIQLDAICFCWNSNYMASNAVTMTMLYQKIESKLWEKYLIERDRLTKPQIEDRETRPLVKSEIDFLGKLAFGGLCNEIIEFDAKQIGSVETGYNSMRNDELVHMQFLRSSDTSIKSYERTCHFIHLTFQEYFAAQYFVRHWTSRKKIIIPREAGKPWSASKEEQIDVHAFLRREKYSTRYDIFWRFVVGLFQEQGIEHLQQFFRVLESEPLDLLGPTHQRLIIHCLNEVHLTDDQFQPQARLIENYRQWILFENQFTSQTMLAMEMECPDRIFVSLLQGTPKMIQICMSSLSYRRNVSRELLNMVMDILEAEDSDTETKRGAYRILGANSYQTSGQRFVDFWQNLHRSRSSDREEAADSLQFSQLQYLGVEALVRLLQDESSAIRSSAAQALGQQHHLEKVVEALVQLLHDEYSDVRSSAVWALGRQKHLPETVIEVLVQLLHDEDSDVRFSAAWALGQQNNLPETVIEALVQLLQDKRSDFRSSAARALGQQIHLPELAIEALVQLLQDRHSDVRSSAAKALGQQGHLSELAVEALAQLLQDKHSNAQYSAAGALGLQSHLPGPIYRNLLSLPQPALLREEVWRVLRGREETYDLLRSLDASLLRNLLAIWLRQSFDGSMACYIVGESVCINIDEKRATRIHLGKVQLETFKRTVRELREELKFPPLPPNANL